jgi:photosystem II stability/assembly factor-like uncharacterized protein
VTDDELEGRLRAHYRDLDPGAASPGLATRVDAGLAARSSRPSAPVRTRAAFGAAIVAVTVVAVGLGLLLGPGGLLAPASPTPAQPTPAVSAPPSAASPTPSAVPSESPSAASLDAATVDLAGTFAGGGLWAVRGSTLFVSTDGGATWAQGTSSIPAGGILAAFVLDASHAWIVAVGPGSSPYTGAPTDVRHLVVERTSDGGQTWQQGTVPGSWGATTQSLVFLDARVGFIMCSAARFSGGTSTVLRTDDGGATWSVAGIGHWLGSMFATSGGLTLWAGAQPEAGGITAHPILDVSRDGGQTWQDARLPGLVGQTGGSVAAPPTFLDANIGAVAVVGQGIFRTSDGGGSWTLASDPSVEASAGPALLDATHWLLPTVNPFGLLSTADGGASWQQMATSGLANGGWIVWIGAVDATHAAALVPIGSSYPGPASLFLSADGGHTWQPADLTVAASATASQPPANGPTPPPIATVSSVAFFDAGHGLDVGATPAGLGAVWRTADGGHTWSETDPASEGLAFVTVAGTRDAWATVMCPNPSWSGETCSLIASSDGGATWHTISDQKLQSLSFVDPTHGWGVGPGGAEPGAAGGGLLSTTDGGRTWTVLPAAPCASIGWPVTVSFVSRLQGWVGCAGMGGAGEAAKGVAETTDGGRTWTMRAAAYPPGMGKDVGSISLSDYLAGLSMQPSGVGLAWESRGGTLRTTDGGRSWTPTPPGGSDAGPVPAGGWTVTGTDWLVLLWDPNAQATVLYASHDGGGTWQTVSHVPGSP